MKAAFTMFAAYNKWANGLLLDACAALPRDDYHKDLGAHFQSIHGTMEHQVIADMAWLQRFTGEGDPITSLDESICGEFEELRGRRERLDERIISVVEQMREADLLRTLIYRTIRKPLVMQQPLGAALFHFFNHQTHHRGQVHSFLTQLGQTPPALDMIYFQRESGHGMAREEDLTKA
ncbi:DinB family protein [Polycladidibacter hongkongensis]|uniref:DinB family protein n=1 Tax=Polycladidibacter hongkongensis TaxID=1647556 RepID=UPI000834ED5A|nr:DinB family protein [Pseudovibrio hongkongensis]